MALTNFACVKKKKKTTKGRKKIEIKKIEKTETRQVTFSKRRTGLFKKASELCILTGAQVAILVNSPGGRVFAFGHPNVNLLVDHYLSSSSSSVDGGATAAEQYSQYSSPPLSTKEFNRYYMEVSQELEAENKRREMIPVSDGGIPWFDNDVEGMEVEEMEQFLWSLVVLKQKVMTRADELKMTAPVMLGGPDVFQMGGFNDWQTVGVPANGGVHGGFIFQHSGGGFS